MIIKSGAIPFCIREYRDLVDCVCALTGSSTICLMSEVSLCVLSGSLCFSSYDCLLKIVSVHLISFNSYQSTYAFPYTTE